VTAIVEAAREILDWLDAAGWRACVIGGLAVQRWGEPRLTQDVDLTVLVGLGEEVRFVDTALGRFPGRRPDARRFALTYRVLLVRASTLVPLDMALGSTQFEIESVDRSSTWEIEPGRVIRTCSAEDLLVHKLIAGRPRDAADVESIVARQFRRLDVERVRRILAAFADLKGEAAFGRLFEDALAKAVRRRDTGLPGEPPREW
jgi:hypothetical protein